MAVDKVKLGGGGKTAQVAREYIQPTQVYRSSDVSDIAKSINSLVGTVGTLSSINAREERERDAEDKLRLTRKAQEESLDVDNAMQLASYDDNLNKLVGNWRTQGLTETEIRTKAKDYKYGKAIQDFELDKGKEADDAVNRYFETFTQLEMKKITPLAKADRQEVQMNMANTIKSNFMVATGDYKDILKDSREVSKTYGIEEVAVNKILIQSAFDKDREGDPSLLEDLDTLKDSKGTRLIDTIEGRAMYNKLMDAKDRRDLDKEALKEQAIKQQQEVRTNELFTDVVTSSDLSEQQVKIEDALTSGNINRKQYSLLMKQVGALSPSEKPYAPYSDPNVIVELQAKAELGTLGQDELINYVGSLKESDYKTIAKKAMEKGGVWGVGSKENDRLQRWIKDTADSESGLGFEEAFKDDLAGGMKAKKLARDIKYELSKALDNFVAINKRLPDKEQELEGISKEIKTRAKARLNRILQGKTTFPQNNATPEQIQTYVGTGEDWQNRYATLTPEQRSRYKAYIQEQIALQARKAPPAPQVEQK